MSAGTPGRGRRLRGGAIPQGTPLDTRLRRLRCWMGVAPERFVLAAPRGHCAGVDGAVETVERALEACGPWAYVRKEIAPNSHTVARLRAVAAVGP